MQRFLILSTFVVLTFNFISAQPVELPLNTNPVLQKYAKKHPEKVNVNRQASNTLTLPFMDDFSYDGPYPDSTLWLDNQAYVNHTLGLNPPSVGVVTLDGLGPDGTPYTDGEGWADTLTCMPIDLSGFTASDNVYMSFFAEPQGRGDAPEAIDKLRLEFRDIFDEWQEVWEISGDTASTFSYNDIFVGSLYLSDSFQFRFINFNANTGFVDLWHLDYVLVDKDRFQNDESYGDVCFTERPHSILRDYTAMPWPHYYFDGNNNFIPLESWAGIDLKINNLSSSNVNLDQTYYRADDEVYDENVLNWTGGSANLAPGSTATITGSLNLNTDLNFSPLIAENPTQTEITTTYYYTVNGQDELSNQPNFILANDTVTTSTIFGNYFAYDDGIAESNIGLNAFGSQAAVQFRLNVDDTLKAIQIHIPHVAGDVTDQSFHLKVWEANLGDQFVVYERNFLQPEYAPGLNGFYEYEVDPPLYMNANNNYYIGWQQASNTTPPIPVGFDKNNALATSRNFYNIGSGWSSFADAGLEGALMIRAVTSEGTVFVNNQNIQLATDVIDIFPNPVRGQLFFNVKEGLHQDYEIEIFNSASQLVMSQNLTQNIPVYQLANGIYFVKLRHKTTQQIYQHKFVKH